MKNLTLVFSLLISTSAFAASPLTKSQVRALVEPTESSVKSCAQAAGVHGTLKVTFKVNADGSVSNFVSKAPHNGDGAAKCAQDAITAIKFPESSKGRQSKYRFQLGGAGAVASNGIGDAIKENQASFSSCGKGQKGSVKATFTIGADGSASAVKVSGKHSKDDVGSCVADAIQKVKFPAQSKPTTVSRSISVQ
ncbi:MAG TPA: hypothetical protein VGO62_06095 [Myxococcota bacterium]|jgi:hypothetical protein